LCKRPSAGFFLARLAVNRFRHSDLNRVIGDEDAPQAMMDNDVPPEQRWRRGDRLRVAWTRIRLVGANQDTLTVVYANLGLELVGISRETLHRVLRELSTPLSAFCLHPFLSST
jgi:hypothetical protein